MQYIGKKCKVLKMKPYTPKKLPISNLNWETFISKIGEANRNLARYDGTLSAMINPGLLLSPLTTQEAVLSSRIEGTQATLEEVLELEAEAEKKFPETEREKDVQEIVNYRQALKVATTEMQNRPMSLNMIKKIHSVLLNSVRGQYKMRGKFRDKQNWIGSPAGSMEDAKYIPPVPNQIEQLMTNLESYIHQEEKDPLVQLAIIHAQFELIHPFLDGNGRVGRILVPLFLAEKGILSEPMFYLSSYLEQNRAEYYERLENISKKDEWEGWINFFLMAISNQANLNNEKSLKVLRLYEDMKQRIKEVTRSQYSIQALDALFAKPIFSTPDFIDKSGIPKQSASRIVNQLEDSDILRTIRKHSGRSPALYAFSELVEIIEE